MGDDLQEGHHGHGREVVHPNHVLRALGGLGDARDGDGRGVGGEDRVRRQELLDLRVGVGGQVWVWVGFVFAILLWLRLR